MKDTELVERVRTTKGAKDTKCAEGSLACWDFERHEKHETCRESTRLVDHERTKDTKAAED